MPARRMRQESGNKERFRQLIREKVAREKEDMKARIDDEMPSWAAWALKPVASFMFDRSSARDNARGEAGEDSAFLNLWLLLPKAWIIINDAVLEPKPGEYIQLDHIAIGPPGVFLVETKAWDGAFVAHKDNWRRKQGNRWVSCSSPTRQSLRHQRLFTHWIRQALDSDLPGDPREWVHPSVVFTRARWIKAEDCSIPVFQGATGFAFYIRRQTRNQVLPADLVDRIAMAIARAGPCEDQAIEGIPSVKEASQATEGSPGDRVAGTGPAGVSMNAGVRVEEGRTGRRRAFVKVHGSREDALAIHREYMEKGRKPTACKPDRYSKEAWYFYID